MKFNFSEAKVKNLELIAKATVFIVHSWFSSEIFEMLYTKQKYQLERLKVNEFSLFLSDAKLSDEAIGVLNAMQSNSLFVVGVKLSFDDFNTYLSLCKTALEISFGSWSETVLTLRFLNCPILLFDRSSNQQLHLVCKSVN